MFKFILIIVIFLIIFLLIKFRIFFKFKVYYNQETVKYKIEDKKSLEANSTFINLDKLIIGDLFYTTKSWNTKNFNYILFNDRYYIIEPGYYYHLIGKIVIKNNIQVNKINKDN